MTPAQFRRLALSLPDVTESSHHGHPDFRVAGKIFASLGYPERGVGVVMLTPDDQGVVVRAHPKVFAPVKGAWGKAGSTTVALSRAERAVVRQALEAAWGRRAPSPEQQLRRFIAKFEPKHQRLIRAVRKWLRGRLPTAAELVYDNYNFFVIGFSPTERPADSILSIVAGANGVSLCFIHGAKLPDPHGILHGGGKQTRFVRVESAATLARPEVDALIAAATDAARVPFPASKRGGLVIRSVSAKQRPRRSRSA